MRWVIVGGALLLMSACNARLVTREDRIAVSTALSKQPAGTQVTDRQLAMADQDKTVVCTEETPVGSHIPKRRCRTMREIEEEKKRAQENHQGGCVPSGADMTGGANPSDPCIWK
ncbi:MAG TPA: hypothetical protein VFA20_24930 [Myxococcaceae bacterium]|nr:hypothetical protein [Myxococcaceae bacterium]